MSEIKKISAYTLGCKLNFAETSTILQKFLDNGFELVEFGEPADLTIINTCTVTSQADKKSRKTIHHAAKFAKEIIVIGCSAQLNTEKYASYSNVIISAGIKDKFRVFELYQQHKGEHIAYSCDSHAVESFDHAYSISGRTRSFLKIQDGCDYKCSYCTIPKARGRSRSPRIEEIIRDAQAIARKGFKEIILTGVNIGDFGRGNNETFFDLLRALDQQVDIPRIRISSVEPELLNEDIIQLIANSGKFLPHFHIPLQSGSDDILRLMRRRYNTRLFARRIETIKRHIPDAFIGIDVIVGFPGESQELFRQTKEFLNDLPFSYLHLFPYSDRPGTEASQLPGKVSPQEKDRRMAELKALSDQRHKQFYLDHLGKEYNVLFEARNKDGKIYGFTENYIKTETAYQPDLVNQIRRVKLIEFTPEHTVKAILL